MAKKHITMSKLQKGLQKDLEQRVQAADADLKKVLEKYELGLTGVPQFAQTPGGPFVVVAQVRFFDARQQPEGKTEKVATA